MNLLAVLRLLIALARLLDIDVMTLAAMYNDEVGNQAYLDELVSIANTSPNGYVD